MKFFKKMSDELWLGIVFLVIAIWLYALNTSYLIISGVFIFFGIMLIVLDNITNSKKTEQEDKKVSKKAVKK